MSVAVGFEGESLWKGERAHPDFLFAYVYDTFYCPAGPVQNTTSCGLGTCGELPKVVQQGG